MQNNKHAPTQVIRTLGTETEHYRSAAQCVAYIAATEIPQNLWPEVIPTLVANVTNMQATEALKESSLEALGYICEELVSGHGCTAYQSIETFCAQTSN